MRNQPIANVVSMDRNEWFAEKATEIGFDELTFLNCRFSERKVIKAERIEKILVSAIKQSLKANLPVLNEMTDFDKFISRDFPGQKFIAHCYEGEKPLLKDVLLKGEDAVVLIGPEGDFSPEEVEKALSKGFQPISLGKSRLRTETAALVACSGIKKLMCKAESNTSIYSFLSKLAEKYLYESHSPIYNEELYLPFLESIVASKKVDDTYKLTYRYQLSMMT